MDLREQLRQALESIADHPRRAIAASMGVFWGAAGIVVLLAAGDGFRAYYEAEFATYGEHMVFVIPGVTSSGFPGHRPGVPVRISRADVAAAEAAHPEVVLALIPEHRPSGGERVLVEAAGRRRRLDLTAVDERFAFYRNFPVGHGRFFDAAEVERGRSVAVLGFEAARELFGSAEAAPGRALRIDGVAFEVVGVADEKGRQYFNTNRPDNRLLIVPVTTAEARLGYSERRVEWLYLFPRPGVGGERALRTVLPTIARRAGFHPGDADAVRFFDLEGPSKMVGLMHAGFIVFVGVAGTITLLIGGIGIANSHLAVLAERTVEVAVAKAIGARSSTLVVAAVLESLIVSSATAALGVGFGLAACWGLGHLIEGSGPVPVVSSTATGVTVAALVGVALVAAVVPARRVARMEIAAALRAAG